MLENAPCERKAGVKGPLGHQLRNTNSKMTGAADSRAKVIPGQKGIVVHVDVHALVRWANQLELEPALASCIEPAGQRASLR